MFDLISKIVIPVLGSMVIILSGVIAHLSSKKRNLEKQLAEERHKTYTKFTSGFIGYMLNPERDVDLNSPETLNYFKKFIGDFAQSLILYASPMVLGKFNETFRKKDIQNIPDSKELVKNLGAFILTLRKDLGLSNKGLKPVDVLQPFIKDDLESYLQHCE